MQYPYVKYPKLVEQYLNDSFPELECLKFPDFPKLIKITYEQLIVSLSLIPLLLFLISYNIGGILVYSIVLLLCVVLLGDSIKHIKSDNSANSFRKKTFNKEVDRIKTENERRKKKLYRLQSSSSLIENYKKEKIKDALKTFSVSQISISYEGKKGTSEICFLKFLFSYFGNNIKPINECSAPNGFSMDYIPDFVFENESILIDIEVDEPYSYESKKAIHLYDDENNEVRDEYFTSNNWVVIRFAEEQVLLNPYECCKYIATLIFELTGNESFLKRLSFLKNPIPIKRWGKSDVENMIVNCYREQTFLKANTLACQLEFYPKNYFVDDGIYILTKIGEAEIFRDGRNIVYINCYNNTVYKSKEILLNKSLFEKINYGETFDINSNEFYKIEDVISIPMYDYHLTDLSKYLGEYKKQVLRLEQKRKFYNINAIKEELGIKVLKMVRQFDNGIATEWVSHWESEKRIRVSMHESVMEKIKINLDIDTLELSKQIVPRNGEREEYIRYVVAVHRITDYQP